MSLIDETFFEFDIREENDSINIYIQKNGRGNFEHRIEISRETVSKKNLIKLFSWAKNNKDKLKKSLYLDSYFKTNI